MQLRSSVMCNKVRKILLNSKVAVKTSLNITVQVVLQSVTFLKDLFATRRLREDKLLHNQTLELDSKRSI